MKVNPNIDISCNKVNPLTIVYQQDNYKNTIVYQFIFCHIQVSIIPIIKNNYNIMEESLKKVWIDYGKDGIKLAKFLNEVVEFDEFTSLEGWDCHEKALYLITKWVNE